MRPYYDHAGIQIFHGDCREVMRQCLRCAVDVVIADPPYGDTSLDWDKYVSGWAQVVRKVLDLQGSMWVFGSSKRLSQEVLPFAIDSK